MNSAHHKKPDHDVLKVQLSELNSRSRWYSSQLWQVPFAYLGLTGVIVANLVDESPSILSLGLIVSAIFGVLVYIHILGMRDGEKRAVIGLKNIENELNLPPAAEYNTWYHRYLGLAVFGAAILYFLLGIHQLRVILCF
jgi:hypothetical protein